MSWAAAKKTVASESSMSARTEETKHSQLMREMGSRNAAWNPEPDDHITAMLREDIELSPNEIKLIAYVKFCCIRNKASGRSAWGETERGQALTIQLIANYFQWHPKNAPKHARRPLAYGFVRQNEKGQFGLGARVDGTLSDELDYLGRINGEYENGGVCTYSMPPYLRADSKRLSKIQQENFLQGWVTRKEAAAARLREAVAACRAQEQKELLEHCQTFGLELKIGKKKPKQNSPGADAKLDCTPDMPVPPERSETHSSGASPIRERLVVTVKNEITSDAPATAMSLEYEFRKAVAKALAAYTSPDDEAVAKLITKCREKAPDCTAEEIVHFIHEKSKAMPRTVDSPNAWLSTAVPKCFAPISLQCYRESLRSPVAAAISESEYKTPQEEIAQLEQMLKDFPTHVESPQWKERLAELLVNHGQEFEPKPDTFH